MKIRKEVCPFKLSKAFVEILEQETGQNNADVILNFRDPNYSAEKGGFHPVEIMVAADGTVRYITDFTYMSFPPELAKEIDFDFENSRFQHMGTEFPLTRGASLFRIWQQNFCAYRKMGVFKVDVEVLT